MRQAAAAETAVGGFRWGASRRPSWQRSTARKATQRARRPRRAWWRLAGLSARDQHSFLSFATGSPRLPLGGVESLAHTSRWCERGRRRGWPTRAATGATSEATCLRRLRAPAIGGQLAWCAADVDYAGLCVSPLALAADSAMWSEGAAVLHALARFKPPALKPTALEFELELIQTQMTQKPVLRIKVGARCIAQRVKEEEAGGGWHIQVSAARRGIARGDVRRYGSSLVLKGLL